MDAVPSAKLRCWRAGLEFFKYPNDLSFAEAGLLHGEVSLGKGPRSHSFNWCEFAPSGQFSDTSNLKVIGGTTARYSRPDNSFYDRLWSLYKSSPNFVAGSDPAELIYAMTGVVTITPRPRSTPADGHADGLAGSTRQTMYASVFTAAHRDALSKNFTGSSWPTVDLTGTFTNLQDILSQQGFVVGNVFGIPSTIGGPPGARLPSP